MVEKIALMSKIDIPYEKAQMIIHQPSIKQISYIGENVFFKGCQYLNFSKKSLQSKGKIDLEKVSDFDVLMTILRNNDSSIQEIKNCLLDIFLLIFPDYKAVFLPTSILFSKKTQEGFQEHSLTSENFEEFKNIVSEMFCLDYILGVGGQGDYNPKGPQAQAIVDKILAGRREVARRKGNTAKDNVEAIYRYVSILAAGAGKDINELMSYSLYQLVDEFRRFKMREEYELVFRLKTAGAQNVESVQNWMSDFNEN